MPHLRASNARWKYKINRKIIARLHTSACDDDIYDLHAKLRFHVKSSY